MDPKKKGLRFEMMTIRRLRSKIKKNSSERMEEIIETVATRAAFFLSPFFQLLCKQEG